MADDMLQPGPSAMEDGISPPQKQATVADVLPPWKIPAEESNEQPQQQPNTINHYEDTITRGMALTALRQAQQVASEFASLREHVDLPGIAEADGQAMVARRPLPGSRYGTLITCFTAVCRHSFCKDRRSLYQPCQAQTFGHDTIWVQVFVMRPCLGSGGYRELLRAAQSTYSKAAAWLGFSTSITKSASEGPAWATIGARRLVKATIAMTTSLRTLKYGH